MIEQLLSFWPYAIGYGFAIIVGQIFIGKIAECLYTDIGITEREHASLSAILGSVERVLFIASLQVGIPEFIAIWLGVKTAGGWKHWTAEKWDYIKSDGQKNIIIGRHAFNIFLTNQALSIGFSAVGWKMIEWLKECAWAQAIAVGLSALIGAIILLILVKHITKKTIGAGKSP